MSEEKENELFEMAAEQTVALGNELLESDEDIDSWEVASGMLAGAIQYWLFSRQPCGEEDCDTCTEVATAAQRLQMLLGETRLLAEESEYYHTPNDGDVGRA